MDKREVYRVWENVLETLKPRLSHHSFETWLRSLKPIGFCQSTLFLEVPDHFSRDWMVAHYTPLIKIVLKNILNEDIFVEFIPSGEIPDSLIDRLAAPANSFYEYPFQLHPKYTFETFVVGNSNRFAHAACRAVAESPGKAYNPLFVYGGVGLGKTHLMQAIGHYILATDAGKKFKVGYVTTEKFTNDLITAIREDDTPSFRHKYRSIDILLIDDIQFLTKKERTQEEFFHTFNSLHEANKQIVISSDRPPKEIPTLEDRLRSRFEWGLIADIQPPELETRIAILQKKTQLENIEISLDVLTYIASKIESNIRELEGALIKLIAYASLNELEITKEVAAEVLKDILPQKKTQQITVPLIQKVVAEYYSIRPEDLKAKKRSRDVVFPRQIAMYLVRQLTETSLPRIGEEFGGRDHSTVIHSCEKISQQLKEDTVLQSVIKELKKRIQDSL